MENLLPPWPLFSAFLLASLVLAVTPGPGVLYVLARSAVQGRHSGLVSVAGVALGNLANALAASLGLAALLATSALAFGVVKLAGAIYLVYLGVMMLRGGTGEVAAVAPEKVSLARIFRDGFVVALLNPKTMIFFAAFLPQFLAADGAHTAIQVSVLGAIFVAVAAITDSVYAWAAGTIAPALTRARGLQRAGRRLGGAIFIGLGIFTALSGTRARVG